MPRLPFLVILLARVATAQQPDSAPGRGSVSGVVVDSLTGAPLALATVQLVPNENATRPRTVTSDERGRYRIDALADGQYLVGFFHARLDSLGLEPPVREVFVRGGAHERLDLWIPSATRIRATVCGAAAPGDSGALVIGFTRTARDGRPAAGVRITGEWHELAFTSSGILASTPRVTSVSLENGWFALCGVPRGGVMGLIASRGGDSSGVVEIQVPADGLARRDLYIAAAPALPTDTTVSAAADENPARLVRSGDLRLHGTVRRVATGQPIAGAQVVLIEGPFTTTNDRGEWTLVDAPGGTRMLEVRALGLYPERFAVDVVASAPPIHVAMNTMRAVLDTISIRAVRGRLRGFEERRRSGLGRYIGPLDLMRFPGRQMSDILRTQPGVRVMRNPDGSTDIYLRSANCPAEVYVDGMYMFSSSDLDHWLRPEDVAGIEIYASMMAPPQFQRPFSGCGSIVIWTR
jgi:hypothetical protein